MEVMSGAPCRIQQTIRSYIDCVPTVKAASSFLRPDQPDARRLLPTVWNAFCTSFTEQSGVFARWHFCCWIMWLVSMFCSTHYVHGGTVVLTRKRDPKSILQVAPSRSASHFAKLSPPAVFD